MLSHANHLEDTYGAGPHTISVPRMRPADGSEVSIRPPNEVRRGQVAQAVCNCKEGRATARRRHTLNSIR